ncbi:nuclease domain-containing protein [Bordetella genomosp. 9]|nr:nuclease domain-containing protein [Bordetella genomosp. 9]
MLGRSRPIRRRRRTPRPTKTLYRNRELLDLAAGQPCLIRVPGVCCGDPATVVACHANESRFGKAKGLKSHDWAAAWGCWMCHQWVDSANNVSKMIRDAYLEDGIKRTRLAIMQLGKWPDEAEAGYQLVFGEAA